MAYFVTRRWVSAFSTDLAIVFFEKICEVLQALSGFCMILGGILLLSGIEPRVGRDLLLVSLIFIFARMVLAPTVVDFLASGP